VRWLKQSGYHSGKGNSNHQYQLCLEVAVPLLEPGCESSIRFSVLDPAAGYVRNAAPPGFTSCGCATYAAFILRMQIAYATLLRLQDRHILRL
jgi:hypothetical protein